MDGLIVKVVLGLLVLAAAGLFLRALLGRGKMLGRFVDRDEAMRQQNLREAHARQAAQQPPPTGPFEGAGR